MGPTPAIGTDGRGSRSTLERMLPLALEQGTVLILVAIAAIPIAAITFALGAGHALREIGKGQFAMDHDLQQRGGAAPVSKEVREAEIRQMIEARSYRRVARGEKPLDVDAELDKLLAAEREMSGNLGEDAELREEVRQLVVAHNERRMRRGEAPLDVDTEVERQLRDLENLGQ
jgi:hypothetical protein